MSDPQKVLSEIYLFLHILIRLDHKLREHLTNLWDNFDLLAPLLRDGVTRIDLLIENNWQINISEHIQTHHG